jgi:Ca2+-binding EF-hand superfamily protein
MKTLFERVDMDGDGTISRTEAVEFIRGRIEHRVVSEDFLAGIWSTFDKSNTGTLSIDEVRCLTSLARGIRGLL